MRYFIQGIEVTKEEFEAEEEIFEMSYIIEGAEFDASNGDAVSIALALWNKGYRKVEK